MKALRLFACALALPLTASLATAQSLHVTTGSVTTSFRATAEDMLFSDGGTQLSIYGKTFAIADIDSIIADYTDVADNTVTVLYQGTASHVWVSGNVAPYLTAEVDGAHVRVMQADDLPVELTYNLSGTSTDGSFYMSGKLKATVALNGLTLTNPDSAAIRIQNGKRIALVLADSTVNTLTDGASGEQKACLMVKGHTEVKGGGELCLTGNTAHAFWGGEYLELKKTAGTLRVLSAVKDGINVNQYYEQKGGTVVISGTGDDGIQVSATDDSTDELNGQALISGGTLSVSVTAAAAKGLKCDSLLTVSGGTLALSTSGGGAYDSSEADVSSSSAIKAGTGAYISGGDLTLKSTGTGGKGLSCDGDITIDGGTCLITTTGRQYSYSRLTASPKGIKADGNLTINGGTFSVTTSGGEGSEGLESKSVVSITGGEIVVTAYDDAINASSAIRISGGKVYALSTGNDAIDSNGTLSISGGLVLACGTREPEAGFDCDENTFSITGGTIIGLGGDSSTPTTSVTTQPVMLLGNRTYSSGQYLTLTLSGSSTPLLAFRVPQAYSGATLLLSHPSLSTGSTYSLGTASSVTATDEWQGYSDSPSVSTTSSSTSITLSSIVTNQKSNGGGGGGGGGQPGGGGGGPGGGGRR